MITQKRLTKPAIKILTERINDEQREFYFYVSASAWCQLNGYEYSARYFEAESQGEKYHYQKIISFLSDWNEKVDFNSISEPLQQFKNLQEVFEKAYEMECAMLVKYNGDAIGMFNEQNVYAVLYDFVHIQNYAVIELNKYLQKLYLSAVDDASLLTFDKETFGEYENLAY